MAELPEELSPWGDPAWRQSVLAWVRERLRERGAAVTGDIEPRHRAWSVTARVRTGRAVVWFKANAPGSGFEPALMVALTRWAPGQVLVPLAVDPERGWSLLPDGGRTLGDLPGGDVRNWEEPLRQYAALQQVTSGHVAEMLRLGVPDLRPGRLPGHFDALLAGEDVRARKDFPYAALRALRPRLAGWCERLAASPVPPALDHSDLHDHQIFAGDGGYVFFDWGDAAVAHPFTSLLIPLRVAAARYGLAAGSPALGRLREAYLEPWTAERPAAQVREEARLAMRLGAISRALTWQRAFPQAREYLRDDQAGAVAYWLARLLDPA